MAKGKGKGKGKGGKGLGGPLSKAEIKAAGGIPEAWKARRSRKRKSGGRKTKSPRRAARVAHLGAAHAAAAKASRPKRTRRKSGSTSKHRRKSGGARTTRSTIVRTSRSATQVAIVPIPGQHHAKPKRRRGKRKASSTPKAAEHRRHRHHGRRRRARESYMMQNPLSPGEIVVGAVTGLVWALAWDATDRALATTPLTAGTTDSAGNTTYTVAAQTTGAYTGMYNGTAVLAPFNASRWIAGLAFVGVPLIGSRFVKNPMGRSALQCSGFGALLGFGIKMSQQLIARLTIKTQFGQRLYDAEMRALVQKQMGGASGTGTATFPLASLPTTGLGRACCGACAAGMPCGCGPRPQGQPQMPPPPPPQPSMMQPPPPPPAPPASAPPAPAPTPVGSPPPQSSGGPVSTWAPPAVAAPGRETTIQGVPRGLGSSQFVRPSLFALNDH